MDSGYNCNKCEKCVRTRMALRALGLRCDTFTPLEDLADLRDYRIESPSELTFVLDTMRMAQQRGDTPLATRLNAIARAYRLRRTAVRIDELLFGGQLKRRLVGRGHH